MVRHRGAETAGADEWSARVQLAAAYRLVARFGMTDLIYTHLSARVPGHSEHFLINPYGWLFDEITASSLVKIDLDGNAVDPATHPVNPAGFVIHSAVHAARPDVGCVMHTHTLPGMAVAASERGLLPLNQISMQFYERIAYHDYEGISLDLGERERLVHDLGDKRAMILRSHGLLTVGRTVPEAFSVMYYLDRACAVQVAALSMGTPVVPPPEVCEHAARQHEQHAEGSAEHLDREWHALLRMLDREDPGYKA
ncbi:MAG: class II aldolase/adducin family protein [Gammaproteobacteria bacterium]|nr:class II aldolase/adducin family protein [Gammaproteobacteria bacterium]NIR84902.1 class II aldolase/adducin family protein [Gammaproteobacteria bacterium]NIR91751.1 class II aldolase/adducin family protein [Gammaproteobacteria bacterium]NIU05949.1 class II aldolase/adducin family protein [Gammaproteobacteria bacterium]NIV52996.1 class II aldolase/adducin family protein [Gammaproteobacteria bacterium]